MTKTNVMRLLEAAGIAYRTAEYEYDEANLSGLHAAEQVGMDAEQVFFKEPTIPPEVAEYEEPVDLAELVGDMNLAKLDQIFKSIMKKQVDRIDPVRSKFGKIEKEEVSLSDKMLYVEDFCKTHRNFSFRNLLEAQASKVEVIVTFLAILELMKVGKIFISQEHTFDDIKIESKMAA